MTPGGETQRTIHIHVGPHKTGSTAIQHALRTIGPELAAKFAITPVDAPCIWNLAKAMGRGDDTAIETSLSELTSACEQIDGDILISCEDLAGDLPGRTSKRRVYPQLFRHLKMLRNAFPGHRVRFYFFVRDKEAWLRSTYVQLLKHRNKFRTFDGFTGFLQNLDGLWDGVLRRSRNRLGDDFVEIPYDERDGFSATQALLTTILGSEAATLDLQESRVNASPSEDVIRLLELANGSGASADAIAAAKRSLLTNSEPSPRMVDACPPAWPPKIAKPDWLSSELEPLWSRVEARANWQLQPNLMPALDCDLSVMRRRLVEAEDAFPEGGRNHMENQLRILRYRFRDLPEVCFLLGLTISYLRRHTGYEDHASFLFQRLWSEEHAVLLAFLPTRWLISTFQTFMDHGITEDQRLIGGAAFFMSNTLKLYEAERALDGLPPGRAYPNSAPATKSGFWGLDRFRVGGSDLMLNMNAQLLELAARDETAGRVLQEFMLRLKKYDSAFSRMDKSRIVQKVDIPQFANCWSFFTPPDIKE